MEVKLRKIATFAGVQVDQDQEPQSAAAVRDLVQEHGLVIMENAGLKESTFADFTRAVGVPVPPPFLEEAVEGSGVSSLRHSATPADVRGGPNFVFASGWHSDWTFLQRPPDMSILWCRTAPILGGGTIFCDAHFGLTGLSEVFAGFLSGLHARHQSDLSYGNRGAYGSTKPLGPSKLKGTTNSFESTHPLVCKSPLSGLKCYFGSPAYVNDVQELNSREGRAVLDLALSQVLWEENMVRVSWKHDMLVIWDNFRFLHRALNEGILGTRHILRSNVYVP